MATDHNFKVKNGLTVQGETLVVNHTGDLSGTQVYIKRKDSSTNLQRWGEGTSGQSTYRWRIDQEFELIGNSGSGDKVRIKSSDGSIEGQSYKIGNTTIIDSSRNLANIGTISSGTITTPRVQYTDSTNGVGWYITTDTYSGGRAYIVLDSDSSDGVGSGSDYVYIGTNASTLLGNLNLQNGGLNVGGTTVIDSSRNLTNIGTISSGAITSTGNITGAALIIDGNTAVDKLSSHYMVFYDGSGAPALYAGNTSDNRNYYQSNHHRFRSDDANTNFGEISATGWHIGGTSTPSRKLQVSGDALITNTLDVLNSSADSLIRIAHGAGNDYDALLQFSGSANDITVEGAELWYDNGVGDLHISTTYNNAAAAIRFHTRTAGSKPTSNERFTITGDGNLQVADGKTLSLFNSSQTSGGSIHLPRAGGITFYGDTSYAHSIVSRNTLGSAVDDIRINSYGAVYINLDSNDNNTAGANFGIGRHGGGSGTMSSFFFEVDGEDGAAIFNPLSDMVVINEPSVDTDLQTTLRVGSEAGGLYLTSSNAIIGKGAYYNGGWIATATTGTSIDFTANDRLTFNTFSGATVGGSASWGARAYISATEIYGYGKLHVAGSNTAEDSIRTTNGRLQLGPQTSGAGIWFDRSSSAQEWFIGLDNADSENLRFYNSGNKMKLYASGTLSTSTSIYVGLAEKSRFSSDDNGGFGINYGTTSGTATSSLTIYNNTSPTIELYRDGTVYVHKGQIWDATTQGQGKGSIHIDPNNANAHAGGAITFGASDHSNGTVADAGIYVRTDGSYGTRMYLATTDSYASGSKTSVAIDANGDLDITRGKLKIGGTAVITTARVLQNVTANASILTSGTISDSLISNNIHKVTTSPSTSGPGNLSMGYDSTNEYSYVQSHASKPLYLNPVGNNIQLNSRTRVNGQLDVATDAYEGSIVFGTQDSWHSGIRQHDDGDAELRIWHKHGTRGRIHIATAYDGEPASISRPTNGIMIYGANGDVGIGNFSANTPAVGARLHVKSTGDYQLRLDGDGSTWAGINFVDSGGEDKLWYFGGTDTWSFGGGGSSNDSDKRLHVHGGVTIGSGYASTASGANNLRVEGRIETGSYLAVPASSDYQKIRLYGNDSQYAIGMVASQTFGGLNDWAMTFMFNNDDDRGFKWMDASHGTSTGAMALTTNGKLTVANSIRVGYGEGDTTTPGAAYDLDVSGHGQVTGRFHAIDGLLKTNRRITTAQNVPIGHFTEGEQVFALDTTWTDAELQGYFNSSNVSWTADSTAPGGYAVYINGNVNVGGVYNSGFPYIPIDQDDEFYMECWIKNAGSGQTHYMGSNEFNQSFSSLGGNPGSYGYWVMSNTNPGSSWTKVTGYIGGFSNSVGDFETGTKYWTPQALFNYGAGSGTRACYISGWKVIRVRHPGNRIFSGNIALGSGSNTGVLKLKTYDDAASEYHLYNYNDDTFRINYNGSGGDEMILNTSGSVTFSGNVTAYSDERLKENIETLDGSKVLQMRGVSFIKDGEAGSGVVAQELEKVAPELVSEIGDFKSVSYGNLTGYLIEAVKLQQEKIEKLEELVQKLISEK